MNAINCTGWLRVPVLAVYLAAFTLSAGVEGAPVADPKETQAPGNSEGFYRKYPHLDDFFPYFPVSGVDCRTLEGERMVEKWNDSYFNIIYGYDFGFMVADLQWEKDWYVEKSLGITPLGQAYFEAMREHRLKIFGHVQSWMGQSSPLNPIHEIFAGKDRELTEQEFAGAEAKLKKELKWFAALSRDQLKDILMIWITDDEPNNVGPTKAMHRMLAKHDPSRPVLNVNPWMPPAEAMIPHVEIQACDFYVHTDSSRRQWDMQDKFEKLYRLNPKAITMFVGDTTTFGPHEQTKPFLRDGRPGPAEERNLVWQAMAGGAKGVGYWNMSIPSTPWASCGSLLDYYYRPHSMNVLSAVAELGQRLTAIGPLFLRTHPELDGQPAIGCATCNYSTYTGPMIRSGVLKHNMRDERLVVLYNQNLDGAASGTVTAPESWAGKQVYDLDRLAEVKADAGTPGRYPVKIGQAGDAVVWLVGTPADFARSQEVILRHRAEMALPLVENRLRLARRWKLDVSGVETILQQAEAQAKAGQYGPCGESRKAALQKAQEVIRADKDKDIGWLEYMLSIVAEQLSGISAKVAGNWRPLGLESSNDADRPVKQTWNSVYTNQAVGGALCTLEELSKAYFESELWVREGRKDKNPELRKRLPMLYEAAKFLDKQVDRIIAGQLAATRKPVRVAYLTAGRECMDFVLTYSWLYDACPADWVTLGDDGLLRNLKKEPVKLSDYDVLWMHQVNSCRPTKEAKEIKLEDVLYPAYLKPEFKEAVKKHVAAGKGLLLTGLSTCFTVALGCETNMPDMYHDGGWYQGSFDAGYKPVTGAEGHPVFAGLNSTGFYANCNVSPYNEVTECTWRRQRPTGRVVASLLDPEIGDIQDYATLVEYGPSPASKGLIMALGGIAMDATPGELSSNNSRGTLDKNQRHLLLNVLEYLAQGKPYAFTVPTGSEPIRQLTMLPSIWRFKLDPKEEGLAAKWYEPGLDESAWKDIPIATSWNSCGYDYKNGYAWYRVKFKAPVEYKGKQLALHFGAVDEVAVVFLDGKEIGRQDDPANWAKAFQFDVTAVLGDCSAEHQLTVRVHKGPVGAGGIWRKVWLEAAGK